MSQPDFTLQDIFDAAPKPPTWLHMQIAPIDGSTVIGLLLRGKPPNHGWGIALIYCKPEMQGKKWWYSGRSFSPVIGEAVRWMPLPPFPTEEEL